MIPLRFGAFLRNAAKLLAVLLSALLPMGAPAADVERPYQLVVVLDIARHRLLTDVFKEQVRRELQDGLRTAFGALADVEVRTDDPQLEEVRKEGLGILEKWKPGTNQKKHFVLIDYAAGQYEIQSRQFDAFTGTASPVIRRDSTADRPFVARLITLMIDRDFGLIGTFRPSVTPRSFSLALRGAETGALMERWVQKDDLFAIVPVIGVKPSARIRNLIVQVNAKPEKGECKCSVLGNEKLLNPRAKEFRCIRLHTIRAPLQVRLVQAGTSDPAGNVQVTLRRRGFDKEDPTKLEERTDPSGFLSTERHKEAGVFDRVAYMTVTASGKSYIFPVPLVDDRPVSLTLPASVQAKGKQLLEIERELWEQQSYEAGTVQQELFEEIKKLDKQQKRKEALARAKEGLNASKESRKQLGADRDELMRKASEAKIDTSIGDQWMKFLDAGHTRLETYISDQEKIFAEENDPERQKIRAWVQQGKLEEAALQFGKALELYEQALKKGVKDANLQKHYDELSAKWKPKGEQHRLARAFIYETWAAVDLVKKPDVLKEAQQAFAECKRVGDTLGPQKLLQDVIAHAGKLQDQAKKLEPDVNEEDRMQLKVIADLADELKKFGQAVQAYLQEKGEK